jgi:pre-rRNA-processing protein IPI3
MSNSALSQICFATSSTDSSIYAWNLYTGTLLKTYKTNTCNKNCSSLLKKSASKCAIISCQSDTSIVNAWSLSKEVIGSKSILNQKFSSFNSSCDGNFLAAGTVQGSLMIWDAESGELLVNFNAHFSSIRVIRFTLDSLHVVSGSDDGSVSVWSLETLMMRQNISPLHCWIDHSASIEDVFVSHDSSRNARILTASKDSFCHYYALGCAGKGEKICSFKLSCEATCCIVDANERNIFIGANSGDIFPISCLDSSIQLSSVTIAEGAGGGVMKHHSAKVNSLSFAPDQQCLLAASEDSTVSCWDVQSRQLIRCISFFKGPVTNVFCSILPLSLDASLAIPMLKRTISTDERTTTVLEGGELPFVSASTKAPLEKLVKLQQEYAHLNVMYEEVFQIANSK